MNFDNLVEDAETNDAFELAVIELLGPAALTGGKLNAYEIAKMFWNAALSSAQPTPAHSEWQEINTADLTDDLIWLFDGVESIEVPRCLEIDDYDRFQYWAECTWPSTKNIDEE